MSASKRGYSGAAFDRYEAHNQQSTIHKMKETYWTTKQAVMKKLGKKEDAHVVASDAELDAKLEVFKAIQKSCMDLLRAIEKYQDRLCALSQEENTMGRFLKGGSKEDKTRAGKMMAAVGKAQSFSSQQRLALRVPLVRLYQEVETFRYRAISDTLMTINRMETARTEYRGALMWMRDVSEVLDPDAYKQLEKFRKVQAQVKKTKAKFDRLKLDSMQKIDLLAASRCNMFSHVLANYQSTLLHFWDKTSRTMSAVAESFKGYQYYEFSMLKELKETSKKLADETGSKDPEAEEASDKDGPERQISEDSDDALLSSIDLNESESAVTNLLDFDIPPPSNGEPPPSNQEQGQMLSFADFFNDQTAHEQTPQSRLIDFDAQAAANKNTEAPERKNDSMSNLLEDFSKEFGESPMSRVPPQNSGAEPDSFIDLGDLDLDEDKDLEEIKRKQDEEFDFTGRIIKEEKRKVAKMKGAKDLLTEELEPDDSDKDDMTLLNEILNAPSTGGDEFSQEWQAVFGSAPMAPAAHQAPTEGEIQRGQSDFMPSNLLDMTSQMSAMRMGPGMSGPGMNQPFMPGMPGAGMNQPMMPSGGPMGNQAGRPQAPVSQGKPAAAKGKGADTKKGQKADMSAWFNLFADLDPLANPDAVGKSEKEMMDAL